MKIIKKGKLPGEELFTGTCSNCRTRFECLRSEGKYEVGDQRDGPFLRATCPLCKFEAIAYP